MEQYISKSALVAEIERRQKIHFNDYHINGNNNPADYGACNALTQILDFIDTLEVKEVEENDSFADSKKHHRASFIKELKHKVSEYEETIKKSSDATKCDDVDWVMLSSDMFDMLQKCLLNF